MVPSRGKLPDQPASSRRSRDKFSKKPFFIYDSSYNRLREGRNMKLVAIIGALVFIGMILSVLDKPPRIGGDDMGAEEPAPFLSHRHHTINHTTIKRGGRHGYRGCLSACLCGVASARGSNQAAQYGAAAARVAKIGQKARRNPRLFCSQLKRRYTINARAKKI